MPIKSRRTLLKQATAGAATVATGWTVAAQAQATGAGERMTLGVTGCGGMGMVLLKSFAAMKDVAIAYVCDADRERMATAVKEAEKAGGKAPKEAPDLRTVLDDKSIDAVIIATPDHWHAPATIMACAAGKHVYVEKPCSHNIREGRLMVEAARRHDRVVQTGTQSRSIAHIIEAMRLLREGIIGDVLVAKAWNSQLRGSIGHHPPADPPTNLNYDLWLGPAPYAPYRPNLLHANWRWWRDFGCGDIGNDGVHDIDIARWGLGVNTHPSTVASVGGKYFFDDDQQFPDTHYVVYEYPGDGQVGHKRQLIYEQRIWSPYRQEGFENGNAFYGTRGMMLLGKHEGWRVFGPRNEPGPKMDSGGFDSTPHHRNFLDCIRTRRRPNADVEIGHLSAALPHLGNISATLGRTLRFEAKTESVVGDEEANRLTRRNYREGHWAVPRL